MPGEVILNVIPKNEVRIEEGGVYASKEHDSVVLCSVTYNGDSYALMGRGAKVHSGFNKVLTWKEVEAYIIANNLKYYGNVSDKIKSLLLEATKMNRNKAIKAYCVAVSICHKFDRAFWRFRRWLREKSKRN